jgi:hypothetical protein
MSTPNVNDFLVGFDPTSATSITGAQLAQMVNGATPNSDRGLILVSTDSVVGGVVTPNVPNASTTTAWQRYIWLRLVPSTNSLIAYVWNPNGATDPTLLNWIPISQAAFGPNSIPGSAIIANTIPSTAIISVAWSQISGTPAFATLNGGLTALTADGILTSNLFSSTSPNFVWGCLKSGATVPGTPVLATGAVTASSLSAQIISGSPTAATGIIKDNTITTLQLLNNGGVQSAAFQAVAAVDPSYNISIPTKSLIGIPSNSNYNPAASGINIAPGDVLGVNYAATGSQAGWVPLRRAILTLAEPTSQTYPQVPYVAPGGTAYSMVTPQGSNSNNPFGRVLQQSLTLNSTPATTGTNLALTGTPTNANVAQVTGFGANGIAFTPLSSSSTLIVEVDLLVSNSSTNHIIGALFSGSTNSFGSSALAQAGAATCSSANGVFSISFKYKVVPGSTNPIYFFIGFAGSANSTGIDETGGGTAILGGNAKSSVKITEYI